jgi:hypothetical protein
VVKFYLYVCWFSLAMMAVGAAAMSGSASYPERAAVWLVWGVCFVVLVALSLIVRKRPSPATVRAMSAVDAEPGSDTWEKTRTARYAAAVTAIVVLFGLPWLLITRLGVSWWMANIAGFFMSFVCARWVHFFLAKADIGKD